MPYCTKCGKENAETAKFCTGCGTSLNANKQTVLQQPESDSHISQKHISRRNWIFITLLLLAGFAVASYFIFLKKPSSHMEDDIKYTQNPVNQDEVTQKKGDLQIQASEPESSYTDYNGKFIYRSDCFIIVTGSFVEEKFAMDYVKTMKAEGHPNSGYLWIPDYPSLSGKRFYATFIGPYGSYSECENNLKLLRINSRFWYGKKVSYSTEQIEIRIK